MAGWQGSFECVSIVRFILAAISFQGYECREAVDGHEGVQLFETDGHFEYVTSAFGLTFLIVGPSPSVILLDMSMPILDGRQSCTSCLADPCQNITQTGYGATAQIRKIEASRSGQKSSYILALTGMSTLEDKRKAFEAGVDG